MILLLAAKYRQHIAFLLLLVADLSFMQLAMAREWEVPRGARVLHNGAGIGPKAFTAGGMDMPRPAGASRGALRMKTAVQGKMKKFRPAIGGPNQPEMGSFKSINAKDLVNLFTGQFNYNVPLLDVGGYPVNMYYSGEVGLEQDASWVGLGWNINPGTISRNMRGIPDDFNGQDSMIQIQNVKPNITWGINTSADAELVGIKFLGANATLTAGVSFNNYLGPALTLGVKDGIGFNIADAVLSEKSDLGLGVSADLSASLSSRSGLTLSPSASLTATVFSDLREYSAGLNLATSYNSRTGIKSLQITEQVSADRLVGKQVYHPELNETSVDGYDKVSNSATVHGNTISFARPSYTPSMRMPMVDDAISGKFQLGLGLFGGYGSVSVEAFQQTSKVNPAQIRQSRPMVGYLYYDQATTDAAAMTDFTRFNDREVTPNTPIISAPQYTYDVFTIQGEGTGGSVRAYRGDLGYVRDNTVTSQSTSEGVGADIGPPGHFGANFNEVKTPSSIGEWQAGNKLHAAIPFRASQPNTNFENVVFRNPGETSVLDPNAFTRIGGTNLVRFELDGDSHTPNIEPVLDSFSTAGVKTGVVNPLLTAQPSTRQKRTQVIDFLTAGDASLVGLDKTIKSYNATTLLDPTTDTLLYTNIQRVSSYRRTNHISQINVTEGNGKRYVYGIPVYNTKQQDFTFTISGNESSLATPGHSDTVVYSAGEENPLTNPAIQGGTGSRDGYAEIVQTPAYAHSFLLTGLLSPDYVDVTGNGITDDDLGTAVKFNYTMLSASHRWRTPVGNHIAHFNAATRSQVKDDKAMVTYGEREAWYLHSIESKTMIAIFTLEGRNDGKGVTDSTGGINGGDNSTMALKQIDLYSKSDLRQNGVSGAKPIKTVHFSYSYTLCQKSPDNPTGGGKLTLDSLWFTYNGSVRANKDKYAFSYLDSGDISGKGNPVYTFGASDRWGTYKPDSLNPAGLLNTDFPYTPQNQQGQRVSPKAALDTNAGAWSLKRILLPSGGQIEVGYEGSDYAYVQNLRATDFLTVAGFGNTPTVMSNRLYDVIGSGVRENNYLFVKVPVACHSVNDIFQKYLQGISQLSVKLAVNMPAGMEWVTSYATIDGSGLGGYGLYDSTTIWIKLAEVNGIGPLSLTAVEYLKEQLPAEAFPGYDVSQGSGLEQIADALVGMLDGLKSAFSDPLSFLRSQGKAQTVQIGQCFARLDDPDGFKYGGGQRVKCIKLKDNWQKMTGQFNSVYTQAYDYTTTEVFNDSTRVISSGVAAYEPGVGGDENPFQTIVQVEDKLPLGPTSYGAVEMPVLEPFFPAPVVGYSQVTVRSLTSLKPGSQQKTMSGIGRQVSEFYTAKDYPVYYSNTPIDPSTDLEAHDGSSTDFFYSYAFDSRALSQGFLVATNDMHGKLKAQSSYAANDTTLRVNYTQNFYRNTGVNGLNELFSFVSAAQGGAITTGNQGIDIELMTDTRQFTTSMTSLDVQGQVDLFPVLFPFWLPFIWPVAGSSENDYKAVTTTKVINYHAVLDSVVVYDKGSVVSTKNLLYDSETGEVIVTRTNNEFNQPGFNTSYPAWWAYSGMGPAYRNIGASFTGLSFNSGVLSGGTIDPTMMESGDEYLVSDTKAASTPNCSNASSPLGKLWLLDLNKNNPPFPAAAHNFVFIDSAGNLYNNNNGATTLRIVRSGKRNMLDNKVATVTSLVSPIVTSGTSQRLSLPSTSNVINATSAEFNEKWQADQDIFPTFVLTSNPATCTNTLTANCNGSLLETAINPYRKGLLGNFRPSRSLAFYGPRTETDPTQPTNLPANGFLANFVLYWDFNTSNALSPNTTSTLWVPKDQSTRFNGKGMELETVNPLGIFTAAQYGFNKNLAVAITQNAPLGQAFDEGFEDYGYVNTIDGAGSGACTRRYIDFSAYGTILNTSGQSFNAHTGSYVLEVTHGVQASGALPVKATIPNSYNLNVTQDTAQVLNNPGGNVGNVTFQGYSPNQPPSGVAGSVSFGSGGFICNNVPPGTFNASFEYQHTINVPISYYISVPVTGTYSYSMQATMQLRDASDAPPQDYSYGVGIDVVIHDLNGNMIGALTTPPAPPPGTTGAGTTTLNGSIFLCAGNYLITGAFGDQYTAFNATPKNEEGCNFSFSFGGFSDWQTLSTQGGCISTAPIAAATTMQNPGFTLVPGTRVEVSAWVREDCGNASGSPCNLTSYTNDHIGLQFPNSSILPSINLHPSGSIIDGWQRIDTSFTVPTDATSASLVLGADGAQNVYFDDIRIHPFNANMTSYVYDPVNLRLVAQLDGNNFATFYEYDEDGTLIRKKAETQRGVQTIQETRSAKQKNITTVQ